MSDSSNQPSYAPLSQPDNAENEENQTADDGEESDPLEENIYGLVLASLLRDAQELKTATGGDALRKILRVLTSVAVYLFMLAIQVFLISSTKELITPPQVKSIRKLYSAYEQHMYTDDAGIEHTYITSNGFLRGEHGFFNPEQFDTLDLDIKSEVCMVPFSQPLFIFCILWIWLVTVLKEFRDAGNKILRLAVAALRTQRSKSRRGSTFVEVDEDTVVVERVHGGICFICIFVVLLPKILLCCYMAWLGARWLVSTVGFSDVLLNAVALAFIFDLASLIYDCAVPYHTKLMVQSTHLPHVWGSKGNENWLNMFGALIILVVAAVLAVCYMYGPQSWGPFAQHVLPDYKWDVGTVCIKYIEAMMNTDADGTEDAEL